MFIFSHAEPQNYEEAIKNPFWVQAIKDKLVALTANQT